MPFFRCFCALILASALLSGSGQAAQLRGSRAPTLPPRTAPPGSPDAQPQPDMKIAAVVNDEVISVFDLVSRMRMVMLSSNIPDSPETRQRIGSQVLRSLIDEKLELQEAKKQNVTATDEEINKALGQIESQNNMKSGQLNDFLKARGIDRGSLVDQLTASIVWAKLVRRQASQTMEITDDEIEDTLKRLKEHANEPQSRVAEIFLAVDNPAQEDEVKRLAERLTEQMKQGARFSAIAQQFSQSATAAVGGDIGWIRADQLPPELGKVVAGLKPGELSPPIRAGGGFYLMLVIDRRNGPTGSSTAQQQGGTVFELVQVVFPLPPGSTEATRRAAIGQAQGVRAEAKDCPTLLKIGKEKAPQLSSQGRLRSTEMTNEMRNLLNRLPVGQPSPPIVQRNGVGVVMVCSKTDASTTASAAPKSGAPTREEVAETLLRQRLDTVARRYLRDLRRAAYVDVRV